MSHIRFATDDNQWSLEGREIFLKSPRIFEQIVIASHADYSYIAAKYEAVGIVLTGIKMFVAKSVRRSH